MGITRIRCAPVFGTAILFVGPFLLSSPFLAAWNRAGGYQNPLAPWLHPILLLSLIAGCAGFFLLRQRTSTKLLMLMFYVPVAGISLLAWAYLWCPLCDF